VDEKQPVSLGEHRAKKAKKPAPRRQYPLRVNLVFVVDGEPKGAVATEVMVEAPADGDGQQVNWAIDARQLAQIIEPLVGVKPAAKLWTPGAQPVRIVKD
jgi:hypothetical protein